MRIRKRLQQLSSIPSAPLPDPHRSEAAQPFDQLSDPQKQTRSPRTAMGSKSNIWVFPGDDTNGRDKMKQKEFADDETWKKEEEKMSTMNDIKRIINMSNGEFRDGKVLQQSSFSDQVSWVEGEHELVPLKKRKGCFDRNPNEETLTATMKSKTNKKCRDVIPVDEQTIRDNETGGSSKSKRGNVIMEGSRCSRVNGRGWRCCQPTLVGYSLCEHHLGKGRLRSNMASARRRKTAGDGGVPPPSGEETGKLSPLTVRKKRTRVGVVKARSMSSLLSQS